MPTVEWILGELGNVSEKVLATIGTAKKMEAVARKADVDLDNVYSIADFVDTPEPDEKMDDWVKLYAIIVAVCLVDDMRRSKTLRHLIDDLCLAVYTVESLAKKGHEDDETYRLAYEFVGDVYRKMGV